MQYTNSAISVTNMEHCGTCASHSVSNGM